MFALQRSRVRRHGAWTVLLWCAAALYPFVLFVTAMKGTDQLLGVGLLASAVLTLVTLVLLPRYPLPVHAILVVAWTAALVEMHNAVVAALQVLISDLGVCVIAALRPRRISLPVAAVTLAVQLLPLLAFLPPSTIDMLVAPVVLTMAVAVMAGDAVRGRRAHAEALRRQATAQAVAAERLRIARELHDMVAHSIGIIAIQAGVGGRVIDTQPAEARHALNAIEATSRETLLGLRRMLTALRRDDPGPAPLGPTPGLDDLDRLAETVEDAGVKVVITRQGERRPVPPDVDLSAYRIVQEAVTNVVRHADTGECRVTIGYGDEELSIEVEDDGRGALLGGDDLAAGFGLVGMRERVGLLRGDFTAGPRPDGGFRVAARIPLPVEGT
ncbi:MAG TPA: sensor histidine kinase [Spirillospora sp.]